jgi:2-oxoglutarate ferredoxin oxidoreductase subunit delta
MQIRNRREFCKGCNICVLVCPSRVFAEGTEVSELGYTPPLITNPEKCPNHRRVRKKEAVCEMCVLSCPDQALFWEEGGEKG